MSANEDITFGFPKVCKNGHESTLGIAGHHEDDGSWKFDIELARSNMFIRCLDCGEPLYPEILPALHEMYEIVERGMKSIPRD